MHIKWQSFFGPVDPQDIKSLIPTAPDSYLNLYAIGDAPFISDRGDKFPAYPIPQITGQYGSCTSMLGLRPETTDTIAEYSQRWSDICGAEFTPIARDGGSELLLLRNLNGSIWHHSPNGRLDPSVQTFQIADSFQGFLERIEFLQ